VALAGGTDVGVTVLGVGQVTNNRNDQTCVSTGSRQDCDARYYDSGWDVTFTATPTDGRWRLANWHDDGPDGIGCNTTNPSCSFTSGHCVFCAYHDHITATFVARDDDGDGSNALVDCNDHNPSIHPGAYDVPHDGIDQNCDGHDNLDADNDGYNSDPGPDCNDYNAAVHPGAPEVAGDGIDENCDGPPDTTLTSATPADGAVVRGTSATFAFASPPNPDWNARFECKLDSGAWQDCSSPVALHDMTDAKHTFQVRGVDVDGFSDPTPASTSWTVDTTPPDTNLTGGPAEGAITDATSATFAFQSEPGARFECSADGAPFTTCSGPGNSHTITGLGLATHSFAVRAVDVAGNPDPTPATRHWRVTADVDGDGYVAPGDCNDRDPSIHPNAVDIPHDGIDQNCDGHDNLDADGDGYDSNPGPDCNDSNPSVHPGAFDIPGDGIDQNCDGHDASFPLLFSEVGAQWRFSPFRFARLYVKRVLAKSAIEVVCHGPGCPFGHHREVVAHGQRRFSVLGRLHEARLRAGAVVSVRVTHSGYIGVMRRYTIRGAGQDPRVTDYCIPEGGGKPTHC
jgi:hypothetical protein